MYSVFLMAAMSAGTQAPDFWFNRGVGCHGGGVFHSSGCAGGGYSASYGCGGWRSTSHGCSGGLGFSCYGGSYNLGWGYPSSSGGYECFGGHGCYGCNGYMGCSGNVAQPQVPETVPPPRADSNTSMSLRPSPDRARVTVELPPDARLFVDDKPMQAAAAKRVFSTPRLDKGQAYYYEVRAEFVRAGKPVSETKRVVIRAGADVHVSFQEQEAPSIATESPPRSLSAEVGQRASLLHR